MMQVRFLSGALHVCPIEKKTGVLLEKERFVLKKEKDNAVIKWFKDVAELVKGNKKNALIVLAFVVLVVIGIGVAVGTSKRTVAEEPVEVDTQSVSQDYVITDEAMQIDAFPEVNELMKKYYDAAAAGDVATIESIKTAVDEKEKIIIEKKAEYIDSYPTVTCYTKSGPVADSYMVFAYYEVKLTDFEKTVPGLNAWYVCKKDDGTLYINDDEQDEKLANYCKVISVQDDVVDLNNTVNVKFNEAVAEDEQLAAFLDLLPSLLSSAVGDELAKNSEDEVEKENTEETDSQEEEIQIVSNVEKKAKTTDVVNIRSSDSETADKVGKAQKGDEFVVLEQKINGWSKIMYNNKECFIKSEYLQIEGEEATNEETTEQETATTTTETDEEAVANSPSSGKAKAKDTVNIRASASTDAERIAVAYKGEEMTVVNKQADGWTKVKFGSKTGFVKSEYLE